MSKSRKDYDYKYESKRAGTRTRNWTLILYPDDLPEDWRNMIDELHFKWVESPLHNQDFNADGTPKKEHHHILVMFDNVKTLEQVQNMFAELFGTSETGTIIGVATPQQVSDRCALVRYMAHMDNPSKAQYDVADIIGHNGADIAELLKYSATETREMIVAMERYIRDNNIVELSAFSFAIQDTHPDWHLYLTTKNTHYFDAFIRSFRNSKRYKIINTETGEVIN